MPVLLMSGHTLNEQVQEILDLGVHSFISVVLYLKNEGALEDYLLDSVCHETVLHRGSEPPIVNDELVGVVKPLTAPLD